MVYVRPLGIYLVTFYGKNGDKTLNFGVDVIKYVLRNILAKFESNACKIVWFRYVWCILPISYQLCLVVFRQNLGAATGIGSALNLIDFKNSPFLCLY